MAKNKFIGQMHWQDRYKEKPKEEFKVDLIDKKILYLLRVNARFSNTFIAKQLKIKRETIAYRIKRMEENNFIYGYSTIVNHKKLGFRGHVVLLKLKTLTTEKELIDYLVNLKEIVRIHNCSGGFDLQLTYSTKTDYEFNDSFKELINKYHAVIDNYELFSIVEEGFLSPLFYINKEDTKKMNLVETKGSSFQKDLDAPHSNNDLVFSLDDKDKLILTELRLNARVSLRDLAQKTGLVPPTVESRIRKLINQGVISSFYAVPSFSSLGYQWYRLFLQVKNIDEKKLFAFLKYHSNASWYISVIGRWNYLVTIFARDNIEFHRILDEIRTEFSDNILSYDSVIVFNRYKDTQRID